MDVLIGCTVTVLVDIQKANLLAESFLRHHPEAKFYIFVVDRTLELVHVMQPGVEYLTPNDLENLDYPFEVLATAFDLDHFISYLEPRVVELLSKKASMVFSFKPYTYVYSSFDSVIQELQSHEIALVPKRITAVPNDDQLPTSDQIESHGTFNSGFVGVASTSFRFIEWWKSETSLRRNLPNNSSLALFELAAASFNCYFERGSEFGVAYWNLDEREISNEADGWFVDNKRLVFANFFGFSLLKPFLVSVEMHGRPRIRLSAHKAIRDFYNSYAQLLTSKMGVVEEDPYQYGYGWGSVSPGLPITPAIREIYRRELLDPECKLVELPPTPFTSAGTKQFLNWMESETQIPGPRLQRFVLAAGLRHPELFHRFVRGISVDYKGIAKWIRTRGRQLDPYFEVLDFDAPQAIHVKDFGRSKSGVDIIGSFNSEHGLGEAGRLLVSAIATTREKVSTISYSPVGIRGKHPFVADNESRNQITVVALNPDQLSELWQGLGDNSRKDRYVIGQWFWELEKAPPWYQSAYQMVDELWAPTKFIESMLRNDVPSRIKVRHMPLPLLPPVVRQGVNRADFEIDDRFAFLFTFDFGSVMKRKNPDGMLRAYLNAFTESDGTQLVIKSTNGSNNVREFEKLMWEIGDRSDVKVIDEYFDTDLNGALMNSIDCYVSLHRSEGLGLTMAEAMSLGKPVIATSYSGNMDFMDESSAFLVPWKYVPVGRDAGAYPSKSVWAEPDLREASKLMRFVFNNQSESASVGLHGKQRILNEFSPEILGQRMETRIREIRRGKYGN